MPSPDSLDRKIQTLAVSVARVRHANNSRLESFKEPFYEMVRRRVLMHREWVAGLPEQVATLERNRWQPSSGITGDFAPEYAISTSLRLGIME